MPPLQTLPSSISPPHTCKYCSNITVYLHIPGSPVRKIPKHVSSNPSQVLLAQKLGLFSSVGLPFRSSSVDDRLSEFYSETKGISFFNISDSLVDIERYAQEGCLLFRRIWRCLLREEERPKKFVLGAWVRAEDSLEFGRLDLDDWGWMALRGESDEEEEAIRAKKLSFSDDLSNVYTMISSPGSPSTPLLAIHPPNPAPSSPIALHNAKTWLSTCLSTHTTCAPPTPSFTPTRLVEILRPNLASSSTTHHYRLHELTPNTDSAYHYAALSYCWGGPQPFATTMQTLTTYKFRIPSSALPQTLQDALHVAAALDLKYLWIDALCIIQDSTADKAREIGRMAQVYGNASVTIAASRAKSVWEGFLSRREVLGHATPERVFQIGCAFADDKVEIQSETLIPSQGINWKSSTLILIPITTEPVAPLDLRGWTFQERILSPRVLDFGAFRTQYICRGHGNSVPSDGWSQLAVDRPYESFEFTYEQLFQALSGRLNADDMRELWIWIMEGFSKRAVSFLGDRLPAVAGLAEVFGKALGEDEEYLAGLWKAAMPGCLMWSRSGWYDDQPSLQLSATERETRAPSWSWARIQGHVLVNREYTTNDRWHMELVKVVDSNVQLADPRARYGGVVSGVLRLRSYAQRAVWVRADEDDERGELLAVDGEIAGAEQSELHERCAFPEDGGTGISISPDCINEDLLDAENGLNVWLVLFGIVGVTNEHTTQRIFGLVVKEVDKEKQICNRVGTFTQIILWEHAERWMTWFKAAPEREFQIS